MKAERRQEPPPGLRSARLRPRAAPGSGRSWGRRLSKNPVPDLEKAATAYITASEVLGNAERWVYQQGVILGDFCQHLRGEGIHHLTDAEPHHLTAFLAACKAAGQSPATLHRKGTVIRAWARWALASGYRKRAPLATARLRTPRRPPLELAQFSEVLEAILGCWNRDYREAFLVLLGAGLRRGELLALRWLDCDLSAGILMVRPHPSGWTPKSRNARAVGIPGWVIEVLANRKTQLGRHGPFQDEEGAPICHESTLSHAWVRLSRARKLGMALKDLRHAHATEALQRGATIRELQAQLGHASVTTTEIYTHVDRKSAARVASAMEGAMPARAEAK